MMKEMLNKINLEIQEIKDVETKIDIQVENLEKTLESLLEVVKESSNYKEMEEKKDILYLEWSRASRKRRELETVRNAILAFNNNHEE